MLYVDALTDGLTLGGVPPDPVRRRELAALGVGDLAARLRALDPTADVDWRNPVRLVRAIEVVEVAGPPLAAARRREPPPWQHARIGLNLPFERLAQRIRARCEEQLARGLIEETERALAAGLPADAQVLTGTGYVEAVAYLRGEVTREDLPELMARNNRRLARRQLRWMRRDPRIRWFDAEPDPVPGILAYLMEALS
jgi:tRNA dimethylallyltransferase